VIKGSPHVGASLHGDGALAVHCLHDIHEKSEKSLKNAYDDDDAFSPGLDEILHGLSPSFGALPPFVLSHQDIVHLIV